MSVKIYFLKVSGLQRTRPVSHGSSSQQNRQRRHRAGGKTPQSQLRFQQHRKDANTEAAQCKERVLSPVRLCDPMDSSLPGSSIHGTLQAIVLEWMAISFSIYEKKVKEKSLSHVRPILCDPMYFSLPGSSVQGIFQTRVLEWVAISFSRGLPDPGIKPRSPTL